MTRFRAWQVVACATLAVFLLWGLAESLGLTGLKSRQRFDGTREVPQTAGGASPVSRAGVPAPAANVNQTQAEISRIGEWVSLFNGQSLDGWKTHPNQAASWTIHEGELIGRGSAIPSHLFTERGDYENFHLKLEAKLVSGDGGVRFRTEFGLSEFPHEPTAPLGYEANIALSDEWKTGSLWGPLGPPIGTRDNLITQDQWFTLEVLAQGNHITVKVNGVVTAEGRDETYHRGHIVLQSWSNGSELRFRNLQLRELPPSASAEDVDTTRPSAVQATPPAAVPGDPPGAQHEGGEEWVSLLTGNELTQWTSWTLNDWELQEGVLRATRSGILYSKASYRDFQMRASLRYPERSHIGLLFHAVPQSHGEVVLGIESGYRAGAIGAYRNFQFQAVAVGKDDLAPPDTWVELELTVRGRQVSLKVDGVTRWSSIQLANLPDHGRIGINVYQPGAGIEVRKLEVRALPEQTPETTPAR